MNQCWFAEETLDGREGWFGTNDAAFAFKALQERSFLAAYISTRANKKLYVEDFVQRSFASSNLEGFG